VGSHRPRALFVNSGILGHRTVAALLRDATDYLSQIDAVHIDLSDGLNWTDRAMRRMFSLQLAPAKGTAGNVDLRRWREELNVGLLAARRIARLERESDVFRLLHFHTQASAYASLRRMRRTPSIVSIDCTQHLASLEADSQVSQATYLPNVVHDALVFERAAAITATSRWAADDLTRRYPTCARKVHVMPYPVRTHFPPSVAAMRATRAQTERGRLVRVLFMGGDLPRKGGFDLLAAWRAGGFASRAALDLVTDWPLASETLPAGVRVLSSVAPHSLEWMQLWQSADLFVMPTRGEAFGMVFQEAAAAALPAIGTRINAVPEIVDDGSTGLLVPPGDLPALVRAMETLITSADLRRQMGSAAHARIAGATVQAYAAKLQTLIAGVLETDDVYAA
jgi:glycosyltransferase involved in cell wall biosynthesis